MDEILTEAIEYLERVGEDDSWKSFYSFSVTEHMIPKTSRAIKNYILKTYNQLVASNTKMRLIGIPAAKYVIKPLDDSIIESQTAYFKSEKECLIAMKKVLNSKTRHFDQNTPKISACGLLLHSICYHHFENQGRLKLAVNCVGSLNQGFNLYINSEQLTSTGNEFIKKLTMKFNEELKRETK
ncbi:MAG: hypothetical protein IJO43_01545 [Bacilli bacterium]|nr:hypothetical protein [Bacilli bacterium]